jgi:hypothetical protein
MTAFGLTVTIGVIGISVTVMDQMSYESKRVVAQDAMDRCVLMTALAQNAINGGVVTTVTPRDVANDCLTKSGAEGLTSLMPAIVNQNSVVDVTLAKDFTFKSTGIFDALTEKDTQTYSMAANFMREIPNIELTIAIDLNSDEFLNKTLFRDQLKKLIRAVTASDTGGKISINILPFGGPNVNLSPDMIDRFNTVNRTGFSDDGHRSCILLPTTSKNTLGINMSDTYRWSWPVFFDGAYGRTVASGLPSPYFDMQPTPFYASTDLLNYQVKNLIEPTYATSPGTTPWGGCRYMSTANNPVLGIQPSRTGTVPSYAMIDSYIDGLIPNKFDIFAQSNNALAMKWALSLMDPSTRPLFNPAPSNGMSSSKVVGRPLDYGTKDSYKILIFVTNSLFFMSDGQLESSPSPSATQRFASMVRDIKPEYLDGSMGMSNIYRADPETPNQNVRFSIEHDNVGGADKFWIAEAGYQNPDPGYTDSKEAFSGYWSSKPFAYSTGNPPKRLSWKEVFESMSVEFLIDRLYMYPFSVNKEIVLPELSYAALADRFTEVVTEKSLLIQHFSALCSAAKKKGKDVMIYTLMGNGLVTPPVNAEAAAIFKANISNTINQVRNCATSSQVSFLLNEPRVLREAMLTIATSISQLSVEPTTP